MARSQRANAKIALMMDQHHKQGKSFYQFWCESQKGRKGEAS